MFARVMRLIYSAAAKPVNDRNAEKVREDAVYILKALRESRAPPHCEGIVEPAIRFVESDAWNLLYLRIRWYHGWPGGDIDPQALANIDRALEADFSNLQENIMPAATAHPVLAELLALIESEVANPGPIVKALEAYLLGLVVPATPTPAAPVVPPADLQAVRTCCKKHGC
jgi:hypothetical protein